MTLGINGKTYDVNELIAYHKRLEKENEELKTKVGLSIDCDKAKKDGELCLGYGGDEDEPCEQCKNCIKCECGYYQLGETEKDDQLTQAKELLKFWVNDFYDSFNNSNTYEKRHKALEQSEQFLKENE